MPGSKTRFQLLGCAFRKRLLSLIGIFLCATTFDTAQAEVLRSDESSDMTAAGIPLYEWRDSTVKEPKAVVVAIHGAAQQGGVLDSLARALASVGYLVIAPDLRGAGRWNTLTHLHSNGSFGDFVQSCDDLSHLLSILKKEHPKSHFFCIGESAGSTVVLSAIVKDSSKIKGIILCSAGSEPKLHAPGSMGPEFYHQLMHVTTPVDMTQFMGRYSSDDSRVASEMVHDPLGRNKLSALELLGTFNFIQQGSVLARQVPKSLPALLIQGKDDQIINANSSVRLLSNLNSSDKNLLMLPGVGHILIGTSYVKPVVQESIMDWLAHHGGINAVVSKSMPPSAPALQRHAGQPPGRSGEPASSNESFNSAGNSAANSFNYGSSNDGLSNSSSPSNGMSNGSNNADMPASGSAIGITNGSSTSPVTGSSGGQPGDRIQPLVDNTSYTPPETPPTATTGPADLIRELGGAPSAEPTPLRQNITP